MAEAASAARGGSGASGSGLEFSLHPLVLVNVSDHYTRAKAQLADGAEPPRQFGLLLGVQTGRTVEITNSFELVTREPEQPGGPPVVDPTYMSEKQEQYKKVFPAFDVVGWYSASSTDTLRPEEDMPLHKGFMELNESPVYLSFGGVISPAHKDLPVTLYESELRMVDGQPSTTFSKAKYTIETVEAERISVDNVARILPSGQQADGAGQYTQHLLGLHSAIKMLTSRIEVMHKYLVAVDAGEVPCDHALVRQISSLLRQLPTVTSERFVTGFNVEHNDTLLMTYVAAMTKGTTSINEFTERFSTLVERARLRHR